MQKCISNYQQVVYLRLRVIVIPNLLNKLCIKKKKLVERGYNQPLNVFKFPEKKKTNDQ